MILQTKFTRTLASLLATEPPFDPNRVNMNEIEAIFRHLRLPDPSTITKIAVGFTNEVYLIEDRYILKICIRSDNEEPFAREAALNSVFEHQLPVPSVIHYDATKTIIDRDFMVCTRVPGANLYNLWHTFNARQRAVLIEQLCGMLRTVNATDLSTLAPGTVPPLTNWKEYIADKIEGHLVACERQESLSREFTSAVRRYVAENIDVLDEAKVALTYFDPHFDNLLVTGERITGLLDLERTEIASIDYVLDLVLRMQRFPTKYMSEHAKQFAKDEDYADLMDLYRQFYPELFDFDNLDIRLNIYEITHDIRDLELWPDLTHLAAGMARIVKSPVDI